MGTLRLIGDVHGHFSEYKSLTIDAEKSIQLGDFGFAQHWSLLEYSGIDPEFHKILGGNHDDYNWITDNNPPHYLGDYGIIEDSGIFYVRGAFSIDKKYRIPNISWWKQEEIYHQNTVADIIELFEKEKPDIVISHDCPRIVKKMLVKSEFRDTTSTFLQFCLDVHQPRLWVFGHHHIRFTTDYLKTHDNNGTKFICLPELEYIDLNL